VRCPGPPQGPNVSTWRSANLTGHAGNPKSRMVQGPPLKSWSSDETWTQMYKQRLASGRSWRSRTAPIVQPSAGVCDGTRPGRLALGPWKPSPYSTRRSPSGDAPRPEAQGPRVPGRCRTRCKSPLSQASAPAPACGRTRKPQARTEGENMPAGKRWWLSPQPHTAGLAGKHVRDLPRLADVNPQVYPSEKDKGNSQDVTPAHWSTSERRPWAWSRLPLWTAAATRDRILHGQGPSSLAYRPD